MKKGKLLCFIIVCLIGVFVFTGCSFINGETSGNGNNNSPSGNISHNSDSNGEYSGEQIYDMSKKSVVEIQTYDISGSGIGTGSGFFVSGNEICTNYHVIEDAYSIKVKNFDGTTTESVKVKGYNKDKDIASLQVTSYTNIEYLSIDTSLHNIGETIYTIGSSKGLTGSFSDGVIASNDRIVEGIACYQITAPISPGNSGGPMLSKSGKVLGINSMTLTDGQNINFAIKINEYNNLDKTKNLTVQQFYNKTTNNGSGGSSGSGGSGGTGGSSGSGTDVDDYTWITEKEPNDDFYEAQYISKDLFCEGSLIYYDMDYFKFYASYGSSVFSLVVLDDDIDYSYVYAGLFDSNDDAVAFGTTGKDGILIDYTIRTSGYYYLVIFRDVDCPYYSLESNYVFGITW